MFANAVVFPQRMAEDVEKFTEELQQKSVGVVLLCASALVLAQEGKHGDLRVCRLFSPISFQPYGSIHPLACADNISERVKNLTPTE